MKHLLLITALATTSGLMTSAQCEYAAQKVQQQSVTITGRVQSEEGKPLEFATVALLGADGTILDGAVCNKDGHFEIGKGLGQAHSIRVQTVGYSTATLSIKPGGQDLGIIRLKPSSTELQAVEIKRQRKGFQLSGTDLKAQIADTQLAYYPTVMHILATLPFVKANNKGIEVQGRGVPLIYYGHRQISQEEVLQLNPKDIKDIDVQLIPDASYPNGTLAVIRINPMTSLERSFGAYLRSNLVMQKRLGYQALAQTYWDTPKLSIKLGGLAQKKIFYTERSTDIQTTDRPVVSSSLLENSMHNDQKLFVTWLDAVYRFAPKHEVGAKYYYANVYDLDMEANITGSVSKEHNPMRSLRSVITAAFPRPTQIHSPNLYYHGQLSDRLTLHAEASLYTQKTYYNEQTLINYTAPTAMTDAYRVLNSSQSRNFSWKAYGDYKLPKGSLQVGYDGTSSRHEQGSKQLISNKEQLIPSVISVNHHSNMGLFASWSHSWTKGLTTKIGLRAEQQQTDVVVSGTNLIEQNKLYLFPSMSISYRVDKFSTSLSYEHTVKHPMYNALRPSISYVNDLLLDTGNPLLLPMQESRISLVSAYRDWTLTASYAWVRNDQYLGQIRYSVDDSFIVHRPENINLQRYKLGLSYSPQIKSIWRPTWSAFVKGQILSLDGHSYNRPFTTLTWKNQLSLRGGWSIQGNLEYQIGGHDANMRYANYYQIDLSLNKQIGHNLSISLSVDDLTTSGQTEYTMNGRVARLYQLDNSDYADYTLSLSYNFRAKADRYRGDTAGNAERSRF